LKGGDMQPLRKVRFTLLVSVAVFAGLMLTVGCQSSAPSNTSNGNGRAASASDCTEPENPYDEGSGHYAGYEWAESSGSGTCGGNSQSFIEGCEEYENQQAAYQDCEAKK
jgi:hypothetical protein